MRTTIIGIVAGLAVSVAPVCKADIVCGAPGVPVGSKVATKVPFKVDTTLTNAYKFVFAGIEAKGNTKGAPGSSGTTGNGGQFHVSAKITCTQSGAQNNNWNNNNNCYGGNSGSNYYGNDCWNHDDYNYCGGSWGEYNDGGGCDGGGNSTRIKSGKITFRDVQDFNTCPLKVLLASPAEVFRANQTPITIQIEWAGEGNAKKPDGVFNIIGEYQKNPPPPTGSLNFAVGEWMLQPEGGNQHPDGVVKIVRE